METSPPHAGLPNRLLGQRVLDLLMVPRDGRGIALACGFVGSAAFGVGTLLTTADPIGWAYLVVAVLGYFFIQTRLVPTAFWLVVAVGGALVATAGNTSGWIECALGLALSLVALTPVRADHRDPAYLDAVVPTSPAAMAPDSSALAEESPLSSARLEESPIPDRASEQSGSVPRFAVRSLGQFDISVKGSPLALEPRLQFLLGYLLARKVSGQESIDRTALAEEIAPGVDRGSQKDRLRKQLYNLQASHPAIGRIIRVTRTNVTLDLAGSDFDVDQLTSAAQRLNSAGELIDADAAAAMRDLLDRNAGEFLDGFEQLEQETTRGRGVASEAVDGARLLIARARADLVRTVADHDLATGHGETAIPYLTAVLRTSVERDDLARILVAAYLQTGQTRLATQARREYGLIEEN